VSNIKVSGFELELIRVLRVIVNETMDYPPAAPFSYSSYLPSDLVEMAQDALRLYGMAVEPVGAHEVREVAA